MDVVGRPEVFGCEVEDVLRLLPGVTVSDAVVSASNPRYQGTGRTVSRDDVEAFIRQVATRVKARLWRFAQTPEQFRENITVMAGDLVANGAASYVQAAVFPAASSPNDGSAYSNVLWSRFQTDMEKLEKTVDDTVGENPGLGAGPAAWSAPAPFFPDGMVF